MGKESKLRWSGSNGVRWVLTGMGGGASPSSSSSLTVFRDTILPLSDDRLPPNDEMLARDVVLANDDKLLLNVCKLELLHVSGGVVSPLG